MRNVFISYSHDSADHKEFVLGVAERLINAGVMCEIDQFADPRKDGDWVKWIKRTYEKADFILIFLTKDYLSIFNKDSESYKNDNKYKGINYDLNLIFDSMYENYGANDRFIPIIHDDIKELIIPHDLRKNRVYKLPSEFDDLKSTILNQPILRRNHLDGESLKKETFGVEKIQFQKLSSEDASDLLDFNENYISSMNKLLEPNNAENILQLIGPASRGKTSLVSSWLQINSDAHNFIAWTFSSNNSTDFFMEAIKALGSEINFVSYENTGRHLADLLKNNNCVLILDGLDLFLNDETSDGSNIMDKAIVSLLEKISFDGTVPCIITSRKTVNDKFPTLEIERLELPDLSTISLENRYIEPQFKADKLASVIAELIPNINAGAETLIGIFGNWGRGKTYLMDLIWKNGIKNTESDNRTFGPTEVVRVDFHAWKYQNTPAIWGFLYSLFLEKYISEHDLKKQNWLKKQFSKSWKIVQLNLDRKGWAPIIWTSLTLIIGAIWYLMLTFDSKWNLLSFLGINGLLFLFFLYGRIPNAKQVIEDYTGKASLLDFLGTQKLVQDELNTLLKRWIKKPEAKKILLFIDDLDRCNIDKIIDVVDALRVILEDYEISNRLIIVIAIDERILKLSIQEKYKNLNFDQSNDQLSSEKMSHEYLDKLFLIGVKLGSIDDHEKSSFINKLTGDVSYNISNQPYSSITTKGIEDSDPEGTETTQNPEEEKHIQVDGLNGGSQETLQINSSITLSEIEQQSLTKAAALIPDTTPRQLKILYFRFVLAKRLINKFYDPYSRFHADYLLGKIINKTITLRQNSGSLPNTEDINLVDLGEKGTADLNDSDIDAAVEIVTTF